jgi:hypothetical protein
MPATITTPVEIADYWIDRLLGRPMPAIERQAIIDFMAAGRNPTSSLTDKQIDEQLRLMVGLIFNAPSFQWR